MFKFNWGTASALIFGTFVVFCIYQVYASTKYDRSLVKEDYYVDDIGLEKLIQKKENAMKIAGLIIEDHSNSNEIHIVIPGSASADGFVQFASPFSSKEDKVFPMKMLNDTMKIDISNLRKGKWNINMDWKDQSKEYAYTKSLILQ